MILALLLVLTLAGAAAAAEPVVLHHGRFEDFEPGTGSGVAIGSDGELTLAPRVADLAEVGAERVWAIAPGDSGQLWVGTGDEGRVYEVPPDGVARLAFDSPEVAVHALAAVGSRLYAGTAPDGLVYRVEADRVTTAARTGSRYVWGLAVDDRGRLLVATGGPARVLRLEGERIDTLFAAVTDGHARCLAVAGKRLFAGTAVAGGPAGPSTPGPPRRGRVYEIEEGRGRLVVETDFDEVTHLVAVGDTLFAAATSAPPPATGTSAPAAAPAAALLRIEPDGAAFPIWQGTGVWAGLVARGDGLLVAVTREPGRILRLRGDGRRHDLVAHVDSLSPSAATASAGALVVGDGHSGRLQRLAAASADSGHFDAPVQDLGARGRWGALEWESEVPRGAAVSLRTRSGNSPEPDETWSPWSAALLTSGSAIPSPPARYLQYRVLMSASDPNLAPRVRRVSFTARQSNLPPLVEEVSVTPYPSRQGGGQGPEAQAQPNGGHGGAKGLPHSKSLRLVRWKATDANGDQLRYRLYLRGEGQADWKPVEEDLDQTTVVWDTATMPEGMTQLRLVATDDPDNPAAAALEDEYVSEPFAIDNSPPSVSLQAQREGGGVAVEVVLEDRVSALRGARYSVDYDDAGHRLAAADGLFDSRREAAGFRLDDLPPGEHVISVQAWDILDNVGVARVVVIAGEPRTDR